MGPLLDPAATSADEVAFLKTLLSQPTDDTAKLVYADWLDERGDPRGTFLREWVAAKAAGSLTPVPPQSASTGWLELTGFTLFSRIEQAKLLHHHDLVVKLAKPALSMSSMTAEHDSANLPIGTSRFGGVPDLPPGVDWPRWDRGTGRLGFLAQIRLGEVAASPAAGELPNEGLLSVFYDDGGDVFGEADEGGWRVLFSPDVSQLERRVTPDDLADVNRFRPCPMQFHERLTLPDAGELPPALPPEEWEAYGNLHDDDRLGHQLLGCTSWLQGAESPGPEWRHLLTIDSDDNPGWMFGDSGLLYFLIRDEDLSALRFDRVWMTFQCC